MRLKDKLVRLKDKLAIVTGGGRDIGRSVSLRLASEGAKVVVNYSRNEASARRTVEEILSAGGSAILHRMDVTRADQAAGLIAAVRARSCMHLPKAR